MRSRVRAPAQTYSLPICFILFSQNHLQHLAVTNFSFSPSLSCSLASPHARESQCLENGCEMRSVMHTRVAPAKCLCTRKPYTKFAQVFLCLSFLLFTAAVNVFPLSLLALISHRELADGCFIILLLSFSSNHAYGRFIFIIYIFVAATCRTNRGSCCCKRVHSFRRPSLTHINPIDFHEYRPHRSKLQFSIRDRSAEAATQFFDFDRSMDTIGFGTF